MRQRVAVLAVAVIVVAVAAIGVTLLQRQRAKQNLVYTVNNFRELAQFVELHVAANPDARQPPDPKRPPDRWEAPLDPKFRPSPLDKLRELNLPPVVPAGTVANPGLAPDERLSWVVPLLPTFNQGRQGTAALAAQLDRTRGWAVEPNRGVSLTALPVLRHYSNPIEVPLGEPAVTQIVGNGGVGAEAPLGQSPLNGCFRYDAATPFTAITDGLSNTVLFADTSAAVGPWLWGGPSTTRPLLTAHGSPPLIGAGGQFGGNDPAGGLFGYADHSVRVHTDRTDPRVLANLFTIAGGDAGALPGE